MYQKTQKTAALLLTGAIIAAVGMIAKPALAQYPYGFGHGGYRQNSGGQLRWQGNVDDTTIIYIHGRGTRTETVQGRSASNVNAQVFGYLPHYPTQVFLQNAEGRGRVRIVQQPMPENDFTAAIRVRDPQPGRSYYNIVVGWR